MPLLWTDLGERARSSLLHASLAACFSSLQTLRVRDRVLRGTCPCPCHNFISASIPIASGPALFPVPHK
eukprot:scaffold12977_cov119-Isochrysis_galbana.AAC.2